MRLTEKNMYDVMGKINKFLSKPTKKYIGFSKHKVGEETHPWMGTIMNFPVYEEKETYKPFIGSCSEHHIRKDYRDSVKNNEYIPADDTIRYHEILLQLSDNYESHCVPLKTGFEITITGDKMIIKENDVTYRLCSGKIVSNKKKSTFSYFYHMDITEEEKTECVRKGIYDIYNLCDRAYYFDDLYREHPSYLSHEIRGVHNDLSRKILDIIETLSLDKPEINVDFEYTKETYMGDKTYTVKLYINIDTIRNGINKYDKDTFYFEINGKRYTELYSVVRIVLKDEIDDVGGVKEEPIILDDSYLF